MLLSLRNDVLTTYIHMYIVNYMYVPSIKQISSSVKVTYKLGSYIDIERVAATD